MQVSRIGERRTARPLLTLASLSPSLRSPVRPSLYVEEDPIGLTSWGAGLRARYLLSHFALAHALLTLARSNRRTQLQEARNEANNERFFQSFSPTERILGSKCAECGLHLCLNGRRVRASENYERNRREKSEMEMESRVSGRRTESAAQPALGMLPPHTQRASRIWRGAWWGTGEQRGEQ